MDKFIVNKWNSVVGKNDLVYHLGNFGFGTLEELSNLLSKLNGKVSIVKGMIDRPIDEMLKVGFVHVSDKIEIIFRNYILQFSNSQIPYEIFPRFGISSYMGVICIHGNTKSRRIIDDNYINVNCDAWNYTPIELSQLVKLYKTNKCKEHKYKHEILS